MSGAVCVPGTSAVERNFDNSYTLNYFSPTQPKVIETWEKALEIFFFLVAVLLTLIGNTIIILIVALNRKMRTTTNVLILNLAVADLFVGVFCMWIHMGNQITEEWPFGEFICKFNTFAQIVVLVSSVLTLTTISVERFIAVVYPFKAKWTPTVTGIIITCIWIVSFGVAIPQLMVRKLYEFRWKDRHQVWCQQDWPRFYKDAQCNVYEPGKIIYYCFETFLMFFFPIIIMICCYTVIVFKLVKRQIPGSTNVSIEQTQNNSKKRIIKMLITVLIVFVLCWTPQQSLFLWDVFTSKGSRDDLEVISYIALYVAYLNSAINPILYGGFNKNFRQGFVDAFRCLLIKRRNRIAITNIDSVRHPTLTDQNTVRSHPHSKPEQPMERNIPSTSNHDIRTQMSEC